MKSIIDYTQTRDGRKNWLIASTGFDSRSLGKWESVFTQGNGYLGIRNSLEEKYLDEMRGFFIAGTFNKASENEVTELPNVPDITNMEIEADGERFTLEKGRIAGYNRYLDLYTGESVRETEWVSPGGKNFCLAFHRFVSRRNDHIICEYAEITPREKATISILSGIDGQVSNSGSQHFTELPKRYHAGDILELPVKTSESDLCISVFCGHRFYLNGALAEPPVRIAGGRRQIKISCTFDIPAGQTLRIEKICAVVTERDMEYMDIGKEKARLQMETDGLTYIRDALRQGYSALLQESEKIWADFWKKQGIAIKSDNETDQLFIGFAMYNLQIMPKKKDPRVGIAAKGLSGEGYKGHSFWDTETFIFPYFQFTEPETARTLLTYRFLGLRGARKKAEEQGFEGAMYPWEAAWIDDGEVTPYYMGPDMQTGEPVYCLTGKIELHITADIIYALWRYYIASGDDAFMDQCGYEMVLDTARFWASRLEWHEDHQRYEICDVIGPDEYKEHVNNNAYTNYMAKYNMDLAAEMIRRIRTEKPALYERFDRQWNLSTLEQDLAQKTGKLYIPMPDEKTGIIAQFDQYDELLPCDLTPYKTSNPGSFFRDHSNADVQKLQVGKQADVVQLLYQLEEVVDARAKKNNYFFYEARTLHDSSLSKAIHSILACDLGMKKEAYSMFRNASMTDIGPAGDSSREGIHSANMGGIWQDVVMGFGGVRIYEDQLRIQPHLPDEWDSLLFPICWRGRHLQISVNREELHINNDGNPFTAIVCGDRKTISYGRNIFPMR